VPNTSEKDFLEDYNNLLKKIYIENKELIIGTDQNIDYLKINTNTNSYCNALFEMNLENKLLPTVTRPTRVTHQGGGPNRTSDSTIRVLSGHYQ
jgi:hypothetical protein